MEFINAEEFLKHPKEIQKIFIDWWKPKFGDFTSFKGISKNSFTNKEDYCFVNEYNEEREQDQYIDSYGIELYNMFWIGNNFSKYGFSFKSRFDVIPLFTETQLRRFIEDKSGQKIQNIEFHLSSGYDIRIIDFRQDDLYWDFENLGTDLLQAYWKVALEITKEEIK